MKNSIKLDHIDKKILEILQKDGKITNAQLSKEIGLSPAPTLERVKKLESNGIIKSYHAVIDKEKLGIGVTVFVLITLSSHKLSQINSFAEKMNMIEEVVECYHITGQADFLLKILTKDIPTYQKLILEKLSKIEEIGSMQSMISLASFKESKVLPLG
jgi:DNA-binding Lrp family transcriptional regulator